MALDVSTLPTVSEVSMGNVVYDTSTNDAGLATPAALYGVITYWYWVLGVRATSL